MRADDQPPSAHAGLTAEGVDDELWYLSELAFTLIAPECQAEVVVMRSRRCLTC